MGKKRLRAKYVSKGQRVPADPKISNMVRNSRHPLDVMVSKLDAFKKGKKVYFTIPNPNPNETNKPFIRVEGPNVYGDFRTFGQPPKKREEQQA